MLKQTTHVALFACASLALHAQDTRSVTEPKVPKSCTVLQSNLQATGNALREENESRLDTERIQKAMDTCAQGQAVELRPEGAHNAFLRRAA